MKRAAFVPRLAAELQARLDELEQERLAIPRPPRSLQPAPPRRRTRSLEFALIERLRASPGSRASLLALELAVDGSTVSSILRTLEMRGEARRAGMGWEMVGPVP